MKPLAQLLVAMLIASATGGCSVLALHDAAKTDAGPTPPGDRGPNDATPPPPYDGVAPDLGAPQPLGCLEQNVASGQDVVAVWAAKSGTFAVTADRLHSELGGSWSEVELNGATVWPITNARAMHGLDHWLAVGGDAGATAELALLNLTTRVVVVRQTTVSDAGPVVDVQVDLWTAGKHRVILLQPGVAHSASDLVDLQLFDVTPSEKPANSSFATVNKHAKPDSRLIFAGTRDGANGFVLIQPTMIPQWSLSHLSNFSPVASWAGDGVEVLVGTPAAAAHDSPSFVGRHDLTAGQGRARAVWGRSATEIYAVGDQGLLSRFDGKSWTQLKLTGDFATGDLVDVWGSSDTRKLWIAVRGRAPGRGGVLRCSMP